MVRIATRDDVPGIARVHVESWHGVYPGLIPDDVIDRLTVERRTAQWTAFFDRRAIDEALFVAEHDGAIVGMASLGPCRDDDASTETGEIRAIYVAPDHWGHGHGRELMGAAMDWLATHGFTVATLWVLDTNRLARRFYELAGWSTDGGRKVEDIYGADVPEVRYRVALESV
ncbi:MAG TPA: GNAT family N-acetyltransferase [Acidimicrobiia bacterium]|nr:GNAT family N-acetyltransferase [Acidimicrobiia bacterium]